MSTPALPRFRSLRPGPRWVAAILCAVLLGVSVAAIVGSVLSRRRWVELAGNGWKRVPVPVVQTASMIEDDGEAVEIVAEALLEPSLAFPVAGARELVLLGLSEKPGSSFGRLLLGRTAYVGGTEALWVRPLELAVAAAPGFDAAPSELGLRYLASWPSLSADRRRAAREVLQRAFRSPAFLNAAFSTAVATLGPRAAVETLPDDPAILRLAAQADRQGGASAVSDLIAARLASLPGGSAAGRPGS